MTASPMVMGGQGNLRGVAYMATYAVFQSLVWVLVRLLSDRYAPELLVFYRNFFGLLAVLPLLWRHGSMVFATKRPWLHGLRGLIACGGVYSLFYALTNAPLATVVAITYLAPLLSGLMAVLVLGERVQRLHVLALALGFTGMMIVVQPAWAGGFTFGIAAALLGAVLTAAAFVTVKVLSRTEALPAMVASQFLLLVPVSLYGALDHWVWPTAHDFALMALMGLGFVLAQAAMARAFTSADATVVLPVDFLRLLVATLAGVILFGEVPESMVWLGALCILVAAVLAAVRAPRAGPVNKS